MGACFFKQSPRASQRSPSPAPTGSTVDSDAKDVPRIEVPAGPSSQAGGARAALRAGKERCIHFFKRKRQRARSPGVCVSNTNGAEGSGQQPQQQSAASAATTSSTTGPLVESLPEAQTTIVGLVNKTAASAATSSTTGPLVERLPEAQTTTDGLVDKTAASPSTSSSTGPPVDSLPEAQTTMNAPVKQNAASAGTSSATGPPVESLPKAQKLVDELVKKTSASEETSSAAERVVGDLSEAQKIVDGLVAKTIELKESASSNSDALASSITGIVGVVLPTLEKVHMVGVVFAMVRTVTDKVQEAKDNKKDMLRIVGYMDRISKCLEELHKQGTREKDVQAAATTIFEAGVFISAYLKHFWPTKMLQATLAKDSLARYGLDLSRHMETLGLSALLGIDSKVTAIIHKLDARLPSGRLLRAHSMRAVPFMLPLRNPHFCGRGEEFVHIHTLLNKSSVVTLSPVVAPKDAPMERVTLLGLGGLGKTQTAVEYGYKYREDYPDGVLWVDAESGATLAFAALALKLGVAVTPESSVQERADRVREALEDGRRTLLVLDNVEREGELSGLLPRLGRTAVIITTRLQLLDYAPIHLSALPLEEAVQILGQEGGAGAASRTVLEDIAQELQCLPLALAITARLLGGAVRVRAQTLLDSLRADPISLLADAPDDARFRKPTSLDVLFGTSLRALEEEYPVGDKRVRLSRLAVCMFATGAWFSGQPIPVALLLVAAFQLRDGIVPPENPGATDSQLALKRLLHFGLATYDPEDDTVSIHRLLQAYGRSRKARGAAAEAAVVAAAGCLCRWDTEAHFRELWERVRPEAGLLGSSGLTAAAFLQMAWDLAWYLNAEMRLKEEAVDILEAALAWGRARKELLLEHRDWEWQTLYLLADVKADLGRREAALADLELPPCKDLAAAPGNSSACGRLAITSLRHHLSRQVLALDAMSPLLEACERALPERAEGWPYGPLKAVDKDSVIACFALTSLHNVVPSTEALLVLERWRRWEQRVMPNTSPTLVMCLKNLIGCYERRGQARLAQEPRRELLELQQRRLRVDSMSACVAAMEAAISDGVDDAALARAEEALGALGRQKTADGAVARARVELGKLLLVKGRADLADSMLGQAIAALQELQGGDVGWDVAAGCMCRSGAQRALGQQQAAAVSRQQAEEMWRSLASSGARHQQWVVVRELGTLLQRSGYNEEAAATLQQALEALKVLPGAERDRAVALALDWLSVAQEGLGQLDTAIATKRREVEQQERVDGAGSYQHSVFVNGLGILLHKAGHYEEAAATLEQALEALKVLPGAESDREVALVLGWLSNTQVALGQLDTAIATRRRQVEQWERIRGPDSFGRTFALHRLRELLDKAGRSEEALTGPAVLEAGQGTEPHSTRDGAVRH